MSIKETIHLLLDFNLEIPWTKNESNIDDHDVKYSMSSLTVQLFTTPSVVEHLIEKEDIMESMFEILVERYFPPKLNGQRSLRSIQKGICSTLLHLG